MIQAKPLLFSLFSCVLFACAAADGEGEDRGEDLASGGSASGGMASSGGASGAAASGGSASGGSGATGSGGENSSGGSSTALLIDDDLEAGLGSWTLRTEGGGSVMTTADGYEGSQGMVATGQVAYLQTEAPFPAPEDKLYVRVRMKWQEAVSQNHVNYITLGGSQDENTDLRFGGQNGYVHFNAAQGDGLAPNPFEYPSCAECYQPSVADWHCVEVLFDWGNQIATYWIDSTTTYTADELSDYHNGAATWPDTGAQLRIGFRALGGANTVYYDDIAVAYERIGCD